MITSRYETNFLCLEKIVPLKIIIARFLHINSGMGKAVCFGKEQLVQIFGEKVSNFVDYALSGILKIDLTRNPSLFTEFRKQEKYIREYFEGKNEFINADKIAIPLIEDIFLRYRLRIGDSEAAKTSKTLINRFKTTSSKEDAIKRDSLMVMEETRVA